MRVTVPVPAISTSAVPVPGRWKVMAMVMGRHWRRQLRLLGLLHACTVAWPVHRTVASAGTGTGTGTIPVVAVPVAVLKAVAMTQHVAAGVCGTQRCAASLRAVHASAA